MLVCGENAPTPPPPPLSSGVRYPCTAISKLAFRRTCCWRAPSIKSSKTCQPEHQLLFRKISPESPIRTSWSGTENLRPSKHKLLSLLFPGFCIESIAMCPRPSLECNWLFSHFRCHWHSKCWSSACFHFSQRILAIALINIPTVEWKDLFIAKIEIIVKTAQ